tara:strand:- start:8905 stop:9714 length:810 start_codon:yes stop_codon:yes gene_type:complete
MYLKDLSKGDFGDAWHTGNPVSVDLKARFPATLELALASLFLAIIIGIPLGVFSSVYLNSIWDHLIRLFGFAGLSIPSFWLGLVLSYVLAFNLGLLPPPIGRIGFSFAPPDNVTGLYLIDSLLEGNIKAFKSSLSYIILPALTLALGQIAGIAGIVRSSMIDALNSDYIRTSYAYGVHPYKIYFKYALKNAMIPTTTYIGNGMLWLLGGVVVIEYVFAWPGLGLYAMDCIFVKDYNGVQGVALVLAASSVIVYVIIDILYLFFDPRVKF